MWQAQGRVYLSSPLLVNKLELGEKKGTQLNFCTVFVVDFLKQWSAKPAGVRDYQHRKTNVIFHHILSVNTLQLMNIKKCLYVIVVIILIKLEVVGPNENCFCSARARAVCRCCWKRFIIIELCNLTPDNCCWIAFNISTYLFRVQEKMLFLFLRILSKQFLHAAG